jgi:HK97 family phage prohead protease
VSKTLELRYHRHDEMQLQLRASWENTVEFDGFATVYDHWYPVLGGAERGGWDELVAPGAATRTLNAKPDVRLLVNHDGLPLARTRSGTLLLTEEERGLRSRAPELDLRNPRVQEVASTMERLDADEMSFAFIVTRQEWNDDYTKRTIREFSLDVVGSDVSLVTYPANPATVAQIRAAAKIDELRAAVRSGMSVATARAIAERCRLTAPAV